MADVPDGLEIQRRWFTPAVLFLVFFCIAWDGFLVFWYTMAFKTGAPWIMAVFPLIHVAVGVALTYGTVAAIFNTTRIRLDWKALSIAHGPIPWSGNRTVLRDQLDQLYCRRITRQRNKGGTSHQYELWMKTRDGKAHKLLGTGLEEDQALFIEQRIEQALGLTDRPVPGELER